MASSVMRQGGRALAVVLLEEVPDEQRHVRAALAQRRHDDRNHLQAVEEVLAEVPASTSAARSLFEAAITRTSTLSERSRRRADLAVLQDAQQLHLQVALISPTSSRKMVPPFASWNMPARCADGAGEGAALVAEHLGLEQLGRDGAAVDGMKGRSTRELSAWTARATSSLPVPLRP
jgi:hypothetical protein